MGVPFVIMVGMNAWFKRHIRRLVNFWPPSPRGRHPGHPLGRRLARRRCRDAAAPLERQLCRHPLRRLALFHGRPVLHADAHREPGARICRLGQISKHPLPPAGQRDESDAGFRLTQQQIDEIQQALTTQEKLEPTFTVEIKG